MGAQGADGETAVCHRPFEGRGGCGIIEQFQRFAMRVPHIAAAPDFHRLDADRTDVVQGIFELHGTEQDCKDPDFHGYFPFRTTVGSPLSKDCTTSKTIFSEWMLSWQVVAGRAPVVTAV